ncbi:MAG TPA: glycosyltransferase family 2 protein [Armatimonadota bacterium]
MHAVTAVIPAYNEATRLPQVLRVVQQATLVHEIIVVDDGSHDGTAEAAHDCGVTVCRLPENCGKGTAMRAGALHATDDILLFLDADLIGLTPAQVDALIRPVLTEQVGMAVGIFQGGRTATDLAQFLSPSLSGQRCLTREFFLSAPLIEGSRSGVEVALTAHARAHHLALALVPLDGATHTMKEEKIGVLRGAFSRTRMYFDIVRTLLRYHLTTRVPGKSLTGNK